MSAKERTCPAGKRGVGGVGVHRIVPRLFSLKEIKFNSNDEIEVPIKNIPDNLKYLNEVVKYIAEELELDYSLCDHQKSFEEAFLETRRPVKEEKKL